MNFPSFFDEFEISVLLKLNLKKKMSPPSFAKDIPNKIGSEIEVSGKNTLIKTEKNNHWRVAIADNPIDAKVDGKKFFCVRVDNSGALSNMMIGFTPMETFDSKEDACFGCNGFTGCGISLYDGHLWYPIDKHHNIIDREISKYAEEIIVILTISNNGKKKEIRFLCDGKESKSFDVSEHLNGDFLFPAICMLDIFQQITTIPIDQIQTRTPEIDNLIKEYQQQKRCPLPRFVSISDFFLQKYPLLRQHEELGRIFLQQQEILFRGLTATLQK
jgi:hypothetical protein